MRANLHVDAQYRFTEIAQVLEAVVAKFEAKLILALGAEAAVALVASRITRALM